MQIVNATESQQQQPKMHSIFPHTYIWISTYAVCSYVCTYIPWTIWTNLRQQKCLLFAIKNENGEQGKSAERWTRQSGECQVRFFSVVACILCIHRVSTEYRIPGKSPARWEIRLAAPTNCEIEPE